MTGPIIAFKNISKRFPGVLALDSVDIDIQPARCHGLVGENGAGKSTLGKILAGIYTPSSGEVFIEGNLVRFASPRDALQSGVGMVHQELSFCENLSVAENLSLGITPSRCGFFARSETRRRAKDWLSVINASVDVDRCLGELPVAQQQMVQIAGAVGRGARILIFDEPTSSLSQTEADSLFDLIDRLKQRGVTSIYVSHRLEEVFRLCETVTVLRDGRVVETKAVKDIDQNFLVHCMIGRSIETYFPTHLESQLGEEVLRVENLSSPGKFQSVSFSLRAGEILGLAGLVGAGRTEIAEALFGLDPDARGEILVNGKPVTIKKTADALKLKIGLIPEDRKRHGLVLSMNARENVTLPILNKFASWGWVHQKKERDLSRGFFERMRVRASGTEAPIVTLSGGNQQKVVLAKWLAARCKILLVDEPTRGVDVGAKAEIHGLIDELARQGTGVLLISSELPEIINLSTRILVLRHGKIVGELSREKANQETLLRLMAGVTKQ